MQAGTGLQCGIQAGRFCCVFPAALAVHGGLLLMYRQLSGIPAAQLGLCELQGHHDDLLQQHPLPYFLRELSCMYAQHPRLM